MNTPRVPLLGICADLEAAATIRQSGADFLEVSVQSFLVPGEDDARFARHLEAASTLPCPIRSANLFLPAGLRCVGPAVDEPALLAYAGTAFVRAAQVGIRCIVFGSGGARRVPEGFPPAQALEQFVALLRGIAPLAERAGVDIVVEPLNPGECNFINTLQQGAEVVEACGHPRVALLADTYHLGFGDEGPAAVRRFGRWLRHFHVAEYPSRRFPGADRQSYREYFEALRAADYPGNISVECRWGEMNREAGQAIHNLRADLAAAGYGAAPVLS